MKPSGKENSIINQEPRGIYKIINELKYRTLASISVFIIFFGLGLSQSKSIINHLIQLFPFPKTIFIQTSLTDPWFILIKTAFLIGIVFTFPIIFYNVISFNSNILHRRNIFQYYTAIIISYISFFIGIFFAYSTVITFLIYLLYGYGVEFKSIFIAYSLTTYINFCLDTITITGLSLALPTAIIYGVKTRILNKLILKKLFKLLFITIIALSFIIALINHLFKFILFIVLALLFYVIGLFICKLFEIR